MGSSSIPRRGAFIKADSCLITTPPASYSDEMEQLERNQPGKVNLILSLS